VAYVTQPTFKIKVLRHLCISEIGKVRNVKFGVWIDCHAYKAKNEKVGQ